ncbi:MAG: hypothetical protein Q4G71_04195, partial [Pseudomonadota bacterium]|nr:hypothetical protein [Pseudomonadota bacterium]
LFVAHGVDLDVKHEGGGSTAWGVYFTLQKGTLTPTVRNELDKLRERMIAQGIEWPPESPTQWRARHVASPIFTSR